MTSPSPLSRHWPARLKRFHKGSYSPTRSKALSERGVKPRRYEHDRDDDYSTCIDLDILLPALAFAIA